MGDIDAHPFGINVYPSSRVSQAPRLPHLVPEQERLPNIQLHGAGPMAIDSPGEDVEIMPTGARLDWMNDNRCIKDGMRDKKNIVINNARWMDK
jgi:hypothetical protein